MPLEDRCTLQEQLRKGRLGSRRGRDHALAERICGPVIGCEGFGPISGSSRQAPALTLDPGLHPKRDSGADVGRMERLEIMLGGLDGGACTSDIAERKHGDAFRPIRLGSKEQLVELPGVRHID